MTLFPKCPSPLLFQSFTIERDAHQLTSSQHLTEAKAEPCWGYGISVITALPLRPVAFCHLSQRLVFPASVYFYKIRANTGTYVVQQLCKHTAQRWQRCHTDHWMGGQLPSGLQLMREPRFAVGKVVHCHFSADVKVWLFESQKHRSQR